MGGFFSDEHLRAMYVGRRADATARHLARLWAAVFTLGLAPKRWVTLEVVGRRSGRCVRFPLGMADWHGGWYLVAMLGEECNWVRERARRERAGHSSAPAGSRLPTGRGTSEGTPPDHQALPREGARCSSAHPCEPARARFGLRGHLLALSGLSNRPRYQPAQHALELRQEGTDVQR